MDNVTNSRLQIRRALLAVLLVISGLLVPPFANNNSGAAIAGNTALTVTVLDRSGQPLQHAVVSLYTGQSSRVDSSVTAVMDQKQLQFSPSVVAIQAGTNVSFPNQDNVRHHVYSFSHPNAFELKLYHGSEGQYQRFEHPGVVVLGCNIHDGMVGYLRVLDTPYFATSDENGKLTIGNAQPGKFTLQVWHPDLGMRLIQKPMALLAGHSSIRLKLDVDDKAPVKPKTEHRLQSLFRN